ncbi:hypothetical protein GGX14DRAFT_620461 [Mycena pura]|uniref:Uncharacterized protein n=1 Tax=Mycena pura TaxID=153505 RepID=A0AAD6VL63_9AGAR|nr:hypothetical protein GGX14DRAFT_620461 [Mycena pura]
MAPTCKPNFFFTCRIGQCHTHTMGFSAHAGKRKRGGAQAAGCALAQYETRIELLYGCRRRRLVQSARVERTTPVQSGVGVSSAWNLFFFALPDGTTATVNEHGGGGTGAATRGGLKLKGRRRVGKRQHFFSAGPGRPCHYTYSSSSASTASSLNTPGPGSPPPLSAYASAFLTAASDSESTASSSPLLLRPRSLTRPLRRSSTDLFNLGRSVQTAFSKQNAVRVRRLDQRDQWLSALERKSAKNFPTRDSNRRSLKKRNQGTKTAQPSQYVKMLLRVTVIRGTVPIPYYSRRCSNMVTGLYRTVLNRIKPYEYDHIRQLYGLILSPAMNGIQRQPAVKGSSPNSLNHRPRHCSTNSVEPKRFEGQINPISCHLSPPGKFPSAKSPGSATLAMAKWRCKSPLPTALELSPKGVHLLRDDSLASISGN